MPPKKQSKKPAKKEAAVAKESAPLPLTESEKESYRVQIEELKEQIQRCERKCVESEVREKDLSSKNAFMLKEKEEILGYMKRSLDKKEDKIRNLSTKLLAFQNVRETENESYEMQLKSLREEFEENKDKLILENKNIEVNMKKVCKQKDEHLTEVEASLKEQIENEKQEHEKVIQDLEAKAKLERNGLKKQMEASLAEAAVKYYNLTEVRIEQQKSAETFKELEKRNATLLATLNKLKKELKISQDLMKETNRKNMEYSKMIEQMKQSCNLKDTQIKKLANHKQQHVQLLAEHKELQKQYEDLRQHNQSVMEMLTQKEAHEEKLDKESKEEKVKREYMETVLSKTVSTMGNFRMMPSEEPKESTGFWPAIETIAQAAGFSDQFCSHQEIQTLKDLLPQTNLSSDT